MEHFKLFATKLALSSQKVTEIQQKLAQLSQDPVMAGNDAVKRALEQANQSAANLKQVQNTLTEKLEAATGAKAQPAQHESELPAETIGTPQPQAELVPEIHTQFEDYGTGAQDQFSRFEGQIEDSLDKPSEELALAWEATPDVAQELSSELPAAVEPMAEATSGTFNQIGVQTDDFDDALAQSSPAFAGDVAQSPVFGEELSGGFDGSQEGVDFSNGIGASFDDYAADPTPTPSFGEQQDTVQVAGIATAGEAKVTATPAAEALPKAESDFSVEATTHEEQPSFDEPQPALEKPQADIEKPQTNPKEEETVPYRKRIVGDFNPQKGETSPERLAEIEANKKQYEEAVKAGDTQMKPLQEEFEDNVQEKKKREKRPEDKNAISSENESGLPDLGEIGQATKSPSISDNTNQGSNDSLQMAESVQNFAMFASSLCNTLKDIDWDKVTNAFKESGLWQSINSLFRGAFDADAAVDKVKNAAEQLKNKLEEAKNAAEKAQEAAEKAEEASEIAQQVADESHEVAWAAQVAAEDAQNAADEAQEVADEAKEAAEQAQEEVDEAAEKAAEKVEDVNKTTEQVQKNAYGLEMGKRTTLNWEDNVEKRKKPEAKKKKGPVSTAHLAVSGAEIKCNYNYTTFYLWISPIHLKKIKGKNVGNINDCHIQNVMRPEAGYCQNTNADYALTLRDILGDDIPKRFCCSFKPDGKWWNGDQNCLVDGAAALQVGSKLSCFYEGTLTITTTGQSSDSESEESTLEDTE